MKREDLEAREFGLIIASSNFPFYAAPEADAVMDAMEARIKELEKALSNAVAGGNIALEQAKKLESKLEYYKRKTSATVFIMNDKGKVLTQSLQDSLILPRVGEYFSYSNYPTTRDNSKPSFRCEGIVKEIEHEVCYNNEFHKHHQYIYIVISKVKDMKEGK